MTENQEMAENQKQKQKSIREYTMSGTQLLEKVVIEWMNECLLELTWSKIELGKEVEQSVKALEQDIEEYGEMKIPNQSAAQEPESEMAQPEAKEDDNDITKKNNLKKTGKRPYWNRTSACLASQS